MRVSLILITLTQHVIGQTPKACIHDDTYGNDDRPNPPFDDTVPFGGCNLRQDGGTDEEGNPTYICKGYFYDIHDVFGNGAMVAHQCDDSIRLTSGQTSLGQDNALCHVTDVVSGMTFEPCMPGVTSIQYIEGGKTFQNNGVCQGTEMTTPDEDCDFHRQQSAGEYYFCYTSFVVGDDKNVMNNNDDEFGHIVPFMQDYGNNYPVCFQCIHHSNSGIDTTSPAANDYAGVLDIDGAQQNVKNIGAARCDVAQSGSQGDPHLRFADGGYADFKGKNNTYVSLLSAPEIQMAGKTLDSTFMLKHSIQVNGSFFTSIAWTFRTSMDYKGLPNYLLNINIDANRESYVEISGAANASLRSKFQNWTIDDIHVEQLHLTTKITARGWVTEATRKPVYNYMTGAKWRYDISIKPLSNKFTCYPHGLIGQSWDGDQIGFIGKTDEYENLNYIQTSAQAEGAIEGTFKRYLLKHANDVNFKYQRFWKRANEICPPRNSSLLTGKRVFHNYLPLEPAKVSEHE